MTESLQQILIAISAVFCVTIVACSSQPAEQIMPPANALIDGDSTDAVFQACNQVVDKLPDDARTKFTDIRLEYIAAYGIDRACDKLRGKTVQQILDEYEPTNVKPRDHGKMDGIKYSIYDAPVESDQNPPTNE